MPIAGTWNVAGFSGNGGPATQALLNSPYDVAITSEGDIIVSDSNNHQIRRVSFFQIAQHGILCFKLFGIHKVNSVGTILTIVGTGVAGFSGDGGPAASARLNFPQGIAVSSIGDIFIADCYNHKIRKVTRASSFFDALLESAFSTQF